MVIEELNSDSSVNRKLGTLFADNHGLNIESEVEFREMVTGNLPPQPNAYRQIRETNMGKITPDEETKMKWKLGQIVVQLDDFLKTKERLLMESNKVLDAKGLACPMPVVRARKVMKEMETGEVLEISATDKGSSLI